MWCSFRSQRATPHIRILFRLFECTKQAMVNWHRRFEFQERWSVQRKVERGQIARGLICILHNTKSSWHLDLPVYSLSKSQNQRRKHASEGLSFYQSGGWEHVLVPMSFRKRFRGSNLRNRNKNETRRPMHSDESLKTAQRAPHIHRQ